jgi:SAM-dependent methyltransferase
MSDQDDLSPTDRLVAVLDHLGIAVAHVATQMPADLAGLAARHAARLAGVVLCVPTRLDPAPFAGLGGRLLMVAGASGPTADTTRRAAERLPAAERVVLDGYDATGWADVAADRTDELAAAMIAFLERTGRASATLSMAAGEGTHAGITWRIEGSGPALVLSPFFLAASQWAPVVPRLRRHFTVVTLGGPHLGGVAALEDRARAPTYRAMFRTLVDTMALADDAAVLDVGCGAGSLDRLLAQRPGSQHRIVAMDTNPFLLREAAALATAAGIGDRIRFEEGNAEALPFGDATFDGAFSVTVLEECDADRAIREMMRVTRPGGRIGIVVRAIDMPQWWNLDLPDALRRKVTVPPQSVGAGGVADAGLYRRMRAAGLRGLTCFPSLVTLDRPDGPIWRYREDHALSLLTPDETLVWRARCAEAADAGLLLTAHAMHCAVGTKPG